MSSAANRAAALFKSEFGGEGRGFFAPGRVNLIGEHIDYNGGRVMPCSLSIGTYAAARRADGRIRLVSADLPGQNAEVALDELSSLPLTPGAFRRFGWAAYPLGVAAQLIIRGYPVGGFDMAVCGDLPRGSGLSSSASLEVLTCAVLDGLYGPWLDGRQAAEVSLAAEHECAGVNCGIMDQFVCAAGVKGHALLLDTHTLDFEYEPFDLDGDVLLIMNTKKPRKLTDSKYNERRGECDEALAAINSVLETPRDALCAVTLGELDACRAVLTPVLFRRARHAVTENERTLAAAQALRRGDNAELGRLLTASHDSLRYDYEVTGEHLNAIVDAALMQEGVLGARMTGAGFGGCAIALCRADRAGDVSRETARVYLEKTGTECEIIPVQTGNSPFGRV
ncbi:MAG: galactokinase [Clostridia bacterium]|nr:galactokinase [Clostridia bacterium]MBQ4342168.1 galactokinase [Clostridia bacterium]